MNPEQIDRVKDLLAETLRLPAGERAGYLAAACPDDTVRREVGSLLAQDGLETPILEQPILGLLQPEEAAAPAASLEAGQRIGAYQILEILDQGGMGTVALARREDDFHKEVALKVIRLDGVSEDTLRRFHNERQLLALLDHPNIARILDGGTTDDGRPYFVMEHIRGLQLDRYCEQHDLDVRLRLELFVQVCAAVQVAHQNLVVHRDLKPSNILVTDDGVPKLLDFGIAKRLDADTVATMTWGAVPLTLRYASPEQVDPRPERPITTASDIYSLGVILYQLLTGRLPYTVAGDSFAGLVRAICETEPRPPSAVVGRRRARLLAGDLDSVVLKALRKDPRQRYGSVEQLADDLRRHLEARPVLARHGNFAYRAVKLIRRHRLRLAAAVTVAVAAIIVTITSTVLWRQAVDERQRSEDVLVFMRDLFKQASPDQARGEDLRALDVLERGEHDVGELDDPLSQAKLLDTIGDVYSDLGLHDDALAPRQRALSILRQQYPEPHPELAKAINDLASTLLRLRRLAEAEVLFREALEMKRLLRQPLFPFLGPPGSEEVDIAKAMSNLATTLTRLQQYEEAENLYRQALDLRVRRGVPGDPAVATNMRNLAFLLDIVGELAEAEELARRGLQIRLDHYGPEHTKTASAHYMLARVLHDRGRTAGAEEHYRRALEIRRQRYGDDHPSTAKVKSGLAALLFAGGDHPTTAALLDEALPVLQGKPDSPTLAEARSVLGALRAAQGRWDEAEPLLVESWGRLVEVYGEAATRAQQAQHRLEICRLAHSDG